MRDPAPDEMNNTDWANWWLGGIPPTPIEDDDE